ncbi:hypothetical protein Vadar_021473 [Vaccinium darrowii]|uniref:Uncharacterized protein n=1 Tax=Vaccinium darrowii TaxID=229202 RepID=A0ACB7YZ40_9ERIC|nr:hypothetical protein Vadar_021473 [Vaccinium darrowii]
MAFAYDIFIVCGANIQSLTIVKNALAEFHTYPELQPNLQKRVPCFWLGFSSQDSLSTILPIPVGKAGWAPPPLKDAALSLDKLREGYVEIIMAMQTLYLKCKLVHGDLNEYPILYFEDFFRKHGVAVNEYIIIRELFDFIVDTSITDESLDSYLEVIQRNFLARGEVISQEDEIAD